VGTKLIKWKTRLEENIGTSLVYDKCTQNTLMYLIASIGMSNEVCWQTNEVKKVCSNIKFVDN
jgi:hypothetical protein